ncbi:MAG: hypothetical protein IPJ88_13335 [Myxococcales bacterium]|nr:MAG: hypothetical protein IPJ88_13335 [Myxococcales bacterium]
MRLRRVTYLVFFVLTLSSIAYTEASKSSLKRKASVDVEAAGEQTQATLSIRGQFNVPNYNIRASNGAKHVVVEVIGAQLSENGLAVTGDHSLIVSTTSSTAANGVQVSIDTAVPVTYHATSHRGKIEVVLREKDWPINSHSPKQRSAMVRSNLNQCKSSDEMAANGWS